MKCPKCGYLGFETTDRCRHCGYDFSLAVPADLPHELPLRSAQEQDSALADFDLDRLIGAESDQEGDAGAAARTPDSMTPVDLENEPPPLPLFGRRGEPVDVITPPPARPPLAVRRATPEVTRRRTPRTVRRESDALDLQLEPQAAVAPVANESPAVIAEGGSGTSVTAPKARRLAAAIVDTVLLGGINIAVLYLTLAIAGLSLSDVFALPPIPMGAFLMILNGGYLVAFTAANGQTIGKMLLGVRVISDDTERVAIGGAVVRAAAVMLSIVTLGLAYIPALVSRDGRALHDRLARTRVIKHA